MILSLTVLEGIEFFMKKRVDWIDALKGFGILLVIIGHTDCPDGLESWIYSFHMPLFFMLSGIMEKAKDYSWKEWFIKKAKSLLWPYFLFGIVEIVFYIISEAAVHELVGKKLLKKIAAILYSNYIFDHNYTGVIWFLSCLFVTELLFFVIHKYIKNRLGRIIVTVSLGTLGLMWESFIDFKPPFFADIALTALLFYSYGFLLRPVLEKESTAVEILPGILALTFGSFLAMYNQRDLDGKHVSMLYLRYGEPIVFVVSACLVLLGFVLIFQGISGFVKEDLNKPLFYLGRNSLIIFSVHLMIMHGLKYPLGDLDNAWQWISLSTLLISVIVTALLNKYCRKVIYI